MNSYSGLKNDSASLLWFSEMIYKTSFNFYNKKKTSIKDLKERLQSKFGSIFLKFDSDY